MRKGVILFLFPIFSCIHAQAQTGIGTTAPDENAVLEVKSISKGLLIPRLSLRATDNYKPLLAHVNGMIVYNTATAGDFPNNVTPGFYYNDGTKWVRVANATEGDKTKDAWIDDSDNTMVKLGTQSDETTARSSGTEVVIKDDGNVGVGTSSPKSKMTIIGGSAGEPGLIVSNNEANNAEKDSYFKTLPYNTSHPSALLLRGKARSTGTTIQLGGNSASNTSAEQIQFYTDNNNTPSTAGDGVRRMEIVNDGKVGIGTFGAPQATLHVNGSTQLTGELKVGGTINTSGNPGTTGQILFSNGTGNAPIWNNTTIITGISRIVVNNEGAPSQSFAAPSGGSSSGNIEVDLATQKYNNNPAAFSFNAADNSITINQAGLYEVKSFISFSSYADIEGDIICSLTKNGTIYKRIIISRTSNTISYNVGSGVGGTIVSTDSYAASDKIEILVNRMGTTSVSTFDGSVNISFVKIY